MLDSLLQFSLGIGAVSAGLMAGVYLAFSGFIMQSLHQQGAEIATRTMNTINRVILKSWFIVVFFGSTILFALLATLAVIYPTLPGRWMLVGIGVSYVIGMFLCTALFNVPLNHRLSEVDQQREQMPEVWQHYLEHWSRWNLLRGLCSLITLGLALYYLITFR